LSFLPLSHQQPTRHKPMDHSDETKIAVLQSEVANLKQSIILQAKEYERRLTELNHAHAQSTIDKSKFLAADMFYVNKDDVNKWRNEIDQWRSKVIGIAIGIGLASGFAGGSIAAALLGFSK
jgi:hypothetical protein